MVTPGRRQLICGRVPKCSFRAEDRYFIEKTRFAPGICPNCGGPINIVRAFTDDVIAGLRMALVDTQNEMAGAILPVTQPAE